MASGKFVTYFRVSTQRQGASGLGLDAQRVSVEQHLDGGDWTVLEEFVEIESGRKTDQERPRLSEALGICKKEGAVLLVAKLDRLARSVHFISGLMRAGVKFVAVDMPQANELTVHIMAAFAEHEAKRISQRTKDALAAAKARGIVLGTAGAKNLRPMLEQRKKKANEFALKLRGVIAGMVVRGMSQRAMVSELNALGVSTPTGCNWNLSQIQRTIKRLKSDSAGCIG